MTATAMRNIRKAFARFRRDDRGATAIEYAMIAVGIAVAVVATVNATGQSLNTNFYGKVHEAVKN